MQKNHITGQKKTQEVLAKLAVKRRINEKIIPHMQQISPAQAANITECGLYVELSSCDDHGDHGDQGVYITNANFCRHRLCAICAWRRQAKFVARTSSILGRLSDMGYGEGDFRLVTLTIRNCIASDLRDTISQLLEGFRRFMMYAYVARHTRGFIRSLEVTYNQEADTYHPHIHIMALGTFIPQGKLIKLWQKAIGVNYAPSVDIREMDSEAKIEVLKYALKPTSAAISLEVCETFYYGLAGRRLISYGGLIRKVAQELKIPPPEDDVLTDDVCQFCGRRHPERRELYWFDATGGVYTLLRAFEKDVG